MLLPKGDGKGRKGEEKNREEEGRKERGRRDGERERLCRLTRDCREALEGPQVCAQRSAHCGTCLAKCQGTSFPRTRSSRGRGSWGFLAWQARVTHRCSERQEPDAQSKERTALPSEGPEVPGSVVPLEGRTHPNIRYP